MPLPRQHTFCHCPKMCLAHLHPKTNICAKFHENRSKTEEVVRDARLRPPARPTDRRHADSYMGQNFERCTIGHFQTLSTSITPGSPPVTQKTISFGVVRKEYNQGFQETYTFIYLYSFLYITRASKCKKMTNVFTLFHFFGTIL